MGSSKGGGSRKVHHFYMSIDYGICHGPIDQINEIVIKDKVAVTGPIAKDGAFKLNKPDLFGGDDAEGGPIGVVEVYLGSFVQKMSSALASRFLDYNSQPRTPDNAPGYRGLAHIFFRGSGTTDGEEWPDELEGLNFYFFGWLYELIKSASTGGDKKGFRWTSNNPYLPPTKIAPTRSPKGLTNNLIYPIVGLEENGDYLVAQPGDAFVDAAKVDRSKLPDANPAAILYECKVNFDWGKGDPESSVDKSSYEAAADVLAAEHFGLSLKWMRQDKLETFSSEVLDHIKAAEFQHPATGLWTLKLIRDDYVVADLPVFDTSNCDAYNIKKKMWGETINEIGVTWTNPESEEEETIYAQNLANIAIQGGVSSDSRDYHGIRNPWLAKHVANRDVAEASRTLTTATIYADRQHQDKLLPAHCIRFTWPEESIQDMVMRITKIEYGDSKDRRIKVEVIEDVFATPSVPGRNDPQPPEGQPGDPVPVDPDTVFPMTIPLPLLTAGGVSVESLDEDYPRVVTGFLVADVDVNLPTVDVISDVQLGNGSTAKQTITSFLSPEFSALGVDLVPEVRSILPAATIDELTYYQAEIGDLFVIGDSDASHEIIMLDSFDEGNGEWTVLRGLYDTIPETWAAGDLLWEFSPDESQLDPRERIAGETTEYNFLPRTRQGRLPLDESTAHTFTPGERPHLPFRPANVSIDGHGFGLAFYSTKTGLPVTIPVTWANRNRTSEDAVANAWDDGNVTPETGQTTTIRVRSSSDGTLEKEYPGITGTSFDLNPSDLITYRYYDVEFIAVRDGLESFRASIAELEIERLGYGFNYGNGYGTA